MTQVTTGEEPATTTGATGPDQQPPGSRQIQTRLVWTAFGVIAIFFGIVGLILYFKPFSDAEPSGEPSLDVFAAGPFEIYEPGTITYFEDEHFYLIRFNDGAFMAVYDLAPLHQARVHAGDVAALKCRVTVREDEAMAGWLEETRTPPGFESTGFYDACAEIAWDARGGHAWGAGGLDLDRFPVETIEEIVRVNLGARRCVNEVSTDAPCIRTQ
jgi:hypothetical protein